MKLEQSDYKRFMDKVLQVPNGCWLWCSTISGCGYAYFTLNYKMIRAHRIAYQLFKGDIPTGLQIDHLCRNRDCVNPEHLQPVTCSENLRRGLTGKINNPQTKKTQCPNGHPLIEGNLTRYTKSIGFRRCLMCNREYHRNYQRRLRAKKEF